jgi:hypothetical protein
MLAIRQVLLLSTTFIVLSLLPAGQPIMLVGRLLLSNRSYGDGFCCLQHICITRQPAKAAPARQGSDKTFMEIHVRQTADGVTRLRNDIMERQSAECLQHSVAQVVDMAAGSAAHAVTSARVVLRALRTCCAVPLRCVQEARMPDDSAP